MRTGWFGFFEMLCLLLFLVLLVSTAAPHAAVKLRVDQELSVVADLDRAALAEHRARFGEGGPGAYLPLEKLRESDRPNGRGGWEFALLFPDEHGRAAAISPAPGARAFLVVAWPIRPAATGFRAYAVNQDLVLHERTVEGALGEIPEELPRITGPAGDPAVRLPPPWRPVLPKLRSDAVAETVRREGLPAPTGLAPPGE